MPASQTEICQSVTSEQSGQTVLAWLRQLLPDHSWSACRKLLVARRVTINGVVTVHEGRRLASGDMVALSAHSSLPPSAQQIAVRHIDADLIVVEKPSGIETTRRPEESHWPLRKKLLQPTLEELASITSLQRKPGDIPQQIPPLFRVQRLDRETSGLVVFGRTKTATQKLIPQFAAHSAIRIYHAVALGQVQAQTIDLPLVRDRGDGRRGSAADQRGGQRAVTHIRPLQHLGPYTLVECQLETGRTHQIRIHLAEAGHPVCGDVKYQTRRDGSAFVDNSAAPRLALHAVRLGFVHPRTSVAMNFVSDWPRDLASWLDNLRERAT